MNLETENGSFRNALRKPLRIIQRTIAWYINTKEPTQFIERFRISYLLEPRLVCSLRRPNKNKNVVDSSTITRHHFDAIYPLVFGEISRNVDTNIRHDSAWLNLHWLW